MEIPQTQDPFDLFQTWLEDAEKTEICDPNAMALATALPDGTPSLRMVLLKAFDRDGFTFFTNKESRKGRELTINAKAALCFHWKTRQRQVRVEGAVETVPIPLVDAYFKTRHVLSRLGAWASRQSQPLENRAALESCVAALEQKYAGGDIPCPPHWGGYRVVPVTIEFWQEGAGRLHDRFLFTRQENGGWILQRLNP